MEETPQYDRMLWFLPHSIHVYTSSSHEDDLVYW